MVTKRQPGSNAELLKKKSLEYFGLYGRKDIIRTRVTETLNATGRIASVSEDEELVIGDLQYDNKLLSEYSSLGIARSGDAVFYCLGTADVQVQDFITVDSIKWELYKQVEGETVDTSVIYKGFLARRIPDA